MELDKSILLQKQVKDNSEDLRSEFLDLKNWEEQMRRTDSEIRNAGGEQIIPPVRRKKKASKEASRADNKENSTESKRIKSYDYSAWDKYDIKKACDEVDAADASDEEGEEPLSKEELEKNHAEATEHKIKGNNFVKRGEWAKAVASYNQSIKVFPYDAVFFANRALCHLKMDNLYSAEADCTAAIQLDEFYVKAYHRRATARISLKRYEDAARDIDTILKLEPSNKEAKIMLSQVNKFMDKSKVSIMSTTHGESIKSKVEQLAKELPSNEMVSKKDSKELKREEKFIVERVNEKAREKRAEELEKSTKSEKQEEIVTRSRLPTWLPEVEEDVEIVDVITKPPHQRSKKPLRTVPIKEIAFGAETQIVNDRSSGEKSVERIIANGKSEVGELSKPEITEVDVPESPKTAVQFLLTWRKNTSMDFKYKYFKKIPSERLPILFQDSMESDIFSQILNVLRVEFTKYKEPIFSYLNHLSKIKRFRTLTMFMSKSDKEDVRALLDYSKTMEGLDDDAIKDILTKYEI